MSRTLTIAALAALALPAVSRAQDSSAYYRTVPTTQKDGTVAFALSFVLPGLGQIYAGEPALGVGMLAATGVAAGVAIHAGGYVERCVKVSAVLTGCHDERRNQSAMTTAALVGGMVWLASMVDAPQAARRFNDRHRVALRVDPGVGGTVRLGLSLRR